MGTPAIFGRLSLCRHLALGDLLQPRGASHGPMTPGSCSPRWICIQMSCWFQGLWGVLRAFGAPFEPSGARATCASSTWGGDWTNFGSVPPGPARDSPLALQQSCTRCLKLPVSKGPFQGSHHRWPLSFVAVRQATHWLRWHPFGQSRCPLRRWMALTWSPGSRCSAFVGEGHLRAEG